MLDYSMTTTAAAAVVVVLLFLSLYVQIRTAAPSSGVEA